ncbi:MAG: chromate resistance protein [Candidatus Brocadiaceae bacterium]|nr:chromate resistance protein [Candidatus Brocadiaceae bacterium]
MHKWILFAHQISKDSANLRVRVWRTLKKYGVVFFKNTVYMLPYSKEHEEMMRWLCKQIRDTGNEASLFISESMDKEQEDEIIKAFHSMLDKEYLGLAESCETVIKKIENDKSTKILTDRTTKEYRKRLMEITKIYGDIQRIDFFQAPQGNITNKTIQRLQQNLENLSGKSAEKESAFEKTCQIKDFLNRKWATRKDVYIDRIASAWLIKRFIDPKARFLFVDKIHEIPENAVPFDMYGAEFTHHGDDCTFETFMKAFHLKDAALQQIAEIVHDIDLKDGRYERAEVEGVERVIRGLCMKQKDDSTRLEKGAELFDALYTFYSKEK